MGSGSGDGLKCLCFFAEHRNENGGMTNPNVVRSLSIGAPLEQQVATDSITGHNCVVLHASRTTGCRGSRGIGKT